MAKVRILRRIHDETGLPRRLYVYTLKRLTKTVLAMAEYLKPMFYASNTSQSLNRETLKAIKRPSRGPEEFIQNSKTYASNGFKTKTEIISHLPMETCDSFIEGMNILAELDFSDFIIYQLIINDGAFMEADDSQEKYKVRYKYRAHPYSETVMDGQLIREYEKVVVENSTMTEDDYYAIRLIGFLIRLNAACGHAPVFNRIKRRFGLTPIQIAEAVSRKVLDENDRDDRNSALEHLRGFYDDARHELLSEPNFEPVAENVETNLVHKYRALILTRAYPDLLDLYFEVAQSLLAEKEDNDPDLFKVFFEVIRGTDLRTLLSEGRNPTLLSAMEYRTETYDVDYLKRMLEEDIQAALDPARIPLSSYYLPAERESIIKGFLETYDSGPGQRTRSYNDMEAGIFELESASKTH